jgi:alpha-L-fucosidase
MGQIVLEGYEGQVQYAQLLHDASEIRMSTKHENDWIPGQTKSKDLILRLPMVKPAVEIPVIELFLK